MGVEVEEGLVKLGSQLCVMKKDEKGENKPLRIGKVSSIERDHKQIDCAKAGSSVAIKVEPNEGAKLQTS